MSGPYRFNGESAKSPLDRTNSPFSAGQPVSFKTNVNRMKTKKWVTAKKNAYDGDDWGDYDEYDEYGVDQQPPPQHDPPAQQQRYYAQPQRSNTDRSFTEPGQQAPHGQGRRNSFEAGEEHRAFSSSIPPPEQNQGHPQHVEPQADPYGRHDYPPSTVPQPLQTRVSQMPADVHTSPQSAQYPPRKSSIGQNDSPVATSPRSAGAEKPLPFIRPADIYRRIEEERERERKSMDSSRPSMDSLSRPKDDLQSPTADAGKSLQPLETVAERKSEYLPDFNAAGPQSNSQQKAPASQAPVVSPPPDLGFRSFVDQAFIRTDDQRSIPPTPVSKDSDTDMSRSNTGSTSGISPIMSRVPSSATSALKRSQAAGEGSTPAIAEEPATTVSRPTTGVHDTIIQPTSRPVPDHTRNLSATSLPQSGKVTPTHGDSPARSPIISPHKDLPEPVAAQLSTGSPDKVDTMKGGLSGPSPAYASREADIASAVKGASSAAAPGLSAAEKHSQDDFLESHAAQDSIEHALPRSRSESPSKGRVQELAGKFGDVSSSRRGSTQSNASRHSVQSWERSQDNSRAPSPTKEDTMKPKSPTKEFRPHLPGQWESYATTAMTPSDQGDHDRILGKGLSRQSTSEDLVELTPTTAKHPVAEVKSDPASDPLSALKNAGAAMAQSIQASVGMGQTTSDDHDEAKDQRKNRSYGDMYMPRPLQLDRTASSISSIPPTPPAKDTPVNEMPPPPPLKELTTPTSTKTQKLQRPEFLPQLSTATTDEDEESDRLRKEIVASLSPVRSLEPTTPGKTHSSLQPGGLEEHRISSVLPAEYDSYWADGGRLSGGPSPEAEPYDTTTSATVHSARPVTPPAAANPAPPALLNRFSWEANSPHLMTPEGAAKGASVLEPIPEPVPEPTKAPVANTVVAPAVERAVEEERQSWSAGKINPYFGPEHSVTITKPDPDTEPERAPQSPKSPIDLASLSSPTREQTRSPGLHVVNSAENPEAVDLPPRLSADLKSPALEDQDGTISAKHDLDKELPNPAISTAVHPPAPITDTTTQPVVPTSPTTGKPLGAREIAHINSTSERIATYNKTRDHWATHDHGLEGWLSSALEANPELGNDQHNPIQRISTGGTPRHKHKPSLSVFGKLGGTGEQQAQGAESSSPSASQPVSTGSPTATTHPNSGSGFDRRVASAQMQLKGKDLLHSAGALSGKGLTQAKGLFAKGKSRFGREKVEK